MRVPNYCLVCSEPIDNYNRKRKYCGIVCYRKDLARQSAELRAKLLANRLDKACSECGIVKPLEEFFRVPRSPDGKSGVCKSCNNEKARIRYTKAVRDSKTLLQLELQGSKTCTKCNRTKPLKDFYSNPSKKHGVESKCKDCFCRNTREWRLSKPTTKWIQECKATQSCSRCGEDDPICLDFHHLAPHTKQERINWIEHHGTLEQLKREVAKCLILCSNCHRKEERDKAAAIHEERQRSYQTAS